MAQQSGGDAEKRIVELEQRVAHQQSVIATYEAANGLYRRLKNFSVLGRIVRRLRGLADAPTTSGVTIIDSVTSDRPAVIGVCNPRFSGGVKSSTYTLCGDVVEVSDMFTLSQATDAAAAIVAHAPARVVISGYTIGYDLLVDEIKRLAPGTLVYAYVHSAFIWFDQYPDENPVFVRFLAQQRAGLIERIGFCKRDVAEYFAGRGYDTAFLMNRFEVAGSSHRLSEDGIVRIGVWGRNLWHRNILNQVIAAQMVPGAEVHVNEVGDHAFLDRGRLVVHGFLPKHEFEPVFRQMDVNLYVSFTDCFPMTLIESMGEGIPCVASDTSDVYAFDPELKSALVVSTVDGPIGIAAAVQRVLENYDDIQERMSSYIPVLSTEVERSIEEFLR